jgi:hypothetical protein
MSVSSGGRRRTYASAARGPVASARRASACDHRGDGLHALGYDVGRHQKRLLAITRDKALAHHEMVLNPPDDTPTYATATPARNSGRDGGRSNALRETQQSSLPGRTLVRL